MFANIFPYFSRHSLDSSDSCIFENGLTASKLMHEYNTRDAGVTTECQGDMNQAFMYTMEVLKSLVWEENFSDVYFLFAHLI